MKKQITIFIFLFMTNNLAAMGITERLVRTAISNYTKTSQQKPQSSQDYDYEVVVEHADGMQSKKIKERCHNGYVVGEISSTTTELMHGSMPYDGDAGSQGLREHIAIVTCKTNNKVCSPAGMCICITPDTRVKHEWLKRK